MAKVGGGAAYIRLQPPKNEISQAMQYWGGIEEKKRAAEKLADERDKVRKKKAIDDWQTKFNLKAGDFKNKYTGFKSYDDINTDFSLYASKKYVDLQRQAVKAMESGDFETKRNLEGQMIRLKNAFGEVSKSQAHFGDLFKRYKEASEKGLVSGASKDFVNTVQEAIMNKNLAIRMTDDGNLVYTGMVNKEDGSQEPFEVSYQDLMDGSFSWAEKQQIDGDKGLVMGITDTLGEISKQSVNGMYIDTEQKWDDKMHGESAKKSIDALVSNPNVMADLLYQVSNGKVSKLKGFTDAEKKQVKDFMYEKVRASYGEKFEKDYNSGKAANQRGWAGINKKKDEEKIDAEFIVNVDGSDPRDGYNPSLGEQYTLKSRGGKPIVGIKENDNKAELLTLRRVGDKYYGQFRQEGLLESETSDKELTLNEVNRLARRMGFRNAKDMDKYLDTRTPRRKNNNSNKPKVDW